MRCVLKTIFTLVIIAGVACAYEVKREELLFKEIPVVVTASRYEQKITEAPSTVTVITEEDIKKFGYNTLAEVLRGVVGFYTTYDREYIRLGARGYLLPGDWGNRILLMVNGHYYNENIYGGAYTGNTFGIDLDLVKRVEIIHGPGSALYGTNALFAVINVITKTGKDLDSANLAFNYGTNNTGKAFLSFGKKVKDDLDVLVSGSLLNSDGYKTLYFPEFGIAENLDWEKANSFLVNLNYGNMSILANTNLREKAYPTAAYSTVFNDTRAAESDQRSFIEIKLQSQVSYDKKGLIRFYYDRYIYNGNFPYDYPPLTLNHDHAEGNWWGSELQLHWDISSAQRLVIGGEYQNHTQILQENYDVDPYQSYLNNNTPRSFYSLYLQDEIKIGKIGLTLGIRQDKHADLENILNPRLGLVFNLVEDGYIKILYGKAFRAPTPFEKYYQDGTTSKPNLNLKPEIINTYELAYQQGSLSSLYLTLSVYRSYISDLISQVTDPADNLLQYQNTGKVQATGAEFFLRKVFGNSYGYLGYAYNNAIDEATNQRISNSPENSGNAGLVLSLPDRKSSLATELIYLGQRKTLAGAYTSPYLLTNVNLRTEALFDSEISLKINNLLDTQYADPGSGEHAMNTIAQDGRTYFVKVSRKF